MHRVELKAADFLGDLELPSIEFLMHRVELKVNEPLQNRNHKLNVPNAPCGVESISSVSNGIKTTLFLMHRVELKAADFLGDLELPSIEFLMHRVELKDQK